MHKATETTRFSIMGRLEPAHLQELVSLKQEIERTKRLHITISSHGGDTNTAVKICDLVNDFMDKKVCITVHAVKEVSSSALIIFLHCAEIKSRLADSDTVFEIDLPHKIIEKSVVLGHIKTQDYLNLLLEENKMIMEARKQWAEIISEQTSLSVENVFDMDKEGIKLSADEAFILGFCSFVEKMY